MGLDITINRVKRIDLSEKSQSDKTGIEALHEICNYPKEDEWIAYFRKANFLFEYFIDDLNESETAAVLDKNSVLDIISRCNEILEDNSKGEELLPTCDGFFFGSTDYDDIYIDKVQKVLDGFEDTLSDFNDEDYFYYIYFSY